MTFLAQKFIFFLWKCGFELQIKIILLAPEFKFEWLFIWILAPKSLYFLFCKSQTLSCKAKNERKMKRISWKKRDHKSHHHHQKSRLRDNCSIAFKNRLVGLWFSKIRIRLNFRFLHNTETKIKTMFKKLDFWKT